jgi:DinB superfamily
MPALIDSNNKGEKIMTSNTLEQPVIAVNQPLTASELDRARLYLEQTQNGITGAIKYLSEPQWKFKPAADRWSIAENVEHIVHVQELVLGPIRNTLAEAPSAPPHPDYERIDEIVIAQFPNRLSKFPSPEPPTGGFTHPEALPRLSTNHARFNEYLETTPGLRHHTVEARPLKALSNGAYESMDGYQWILAAAAHTERHTKQILEVMAEADFPAR